MLRSSWRWTYAFFLLLVASSANACIHDELDHQIIAHDQSYADDHPFLVAERRRRLQILENDNVMNAQQYEDRAEAMASSESLYAPLRITPYYDAESLNALPADHRHVVQRIVPDAIRRFRLMLSVVPVQGNLYAKRSCDLQYKTTPPVCKTVLEDEKCLEMPIPPSHFGPTRVCSTCYSAGCAVGNCTTMPGDGVPDADFVLYVRAQNTTYCNRNVLAYASSCQKDQFDRPTFGMANFCPQLIDSNPYEYESQLATALHEITHALGFSSQFFAYMRDPEGNPRTKRDENGNPPALVSSKCPNGNPIDFFVHPDESTVQYVNERNHVVAKMVTPTVAAFVKDHFDCKTLLGAELESQDDGCLGSHWEERLFEPEYMTPVSSFLNVVSGLTLAFFEDSGWYKTNASMASAMHFGKNKGCSFAHESCINKDTNVPVAADHFCVTNDVESCSVDAAARSMCFINTGRSIPPEYQYFSDPTKGGTNQFADFCPTNAGFAQGDCTIATNLQTPPGTTLNLMGETYCPTCKCAKSSLSLPNSGWSVNKRRRSGCYAMHCPTPNRIEVSLPLGDAIVTINCTTTGSVMTVPGFNGEFTCPDPAIVCETRCPRACSGNGLCDFVSQTCACDDGWTGVDCATNTSAPVLTAPLVTEPPTAPTTVPTKTTTSTTPSSTTSTTPMGPTELPTTPKPVTVAPDTNSTTSAPSEAPTSEPTPVPTTTTTPSSTNLRASASRINQPTLVGTLLLMLPVLVR